MVKLKLEFISGTSWCCIRVRFLALLSSRKHSPAFFVPTTRVPADLHSPIELILSISQAISV